MSAQDEVVQPPVAPVGAGWQDLAACRGSDPVLFFPERGASTKEAREVCRGCRVRFDCLEHSMVVPERFGIWGGLSEKHRRRLRRIRTNAARTAEMAGIAPPVIFPDVEHDDDDDITVEDVDDDDVADVVVLYPRGPR